MCVRGEGGWRERGGGERRGLKESIGPIGKGGDEGEEKEKAIKRQVRWRGEGDGEGEEEIEEKGRRRRREEQPRNTCTYTLICIRSGGDIFWLICVPTA